MTQTLLYGIHDIEGNHIVPAGGWCLSLIELCKKPAGIDYLRIRDDINWMVRANWGYEGTGTIPLPAQDDEYIANFISFLISSRGIHTIVVGNEIAMWWERPNGQPITPERYAEFYNKVVGKVSPLFPEIAFSPAAPAPYRENWTQEFNKTLRLLNPSLVRAIVIHAYARSANPSAITDTTKMDAPLEGLYYGFLTYRDALAAVPDRLRDLPAHITEFDEDLPEGWIDSNTGIVKAAYDEISWWNQQPGTQKVRSLKLYRWPRYDKWYIEGKNGVIADFKEAVAKGYKSPEIGGSVVPQGQHQTFIPHVSTGGDKPQVSVPERNISEDFKRRVPQGLFRSVVPGYRLIEAGYYPDGAQRFGPDHHILVDVLDANGNRKMGVPVHFYWAGDETVVPTNKIGGPYAADYGMTSAGHSFGVWVGDNEAASDDVFGMGLGKIGNEHMGDHVTYRLVFQEIVGQQAAAQPARPPATPTQPVVMPPLLHPVQDPRYRNVTQVFGVNEQYYRQFAVDGVPLKGHNGIDFGTPIGTIIGAVDAGRVAEVGNDPFGYGKYVKLVHSWGESLYAHLSNTNFDVGDQVGRGAWLGDSGNTGKSTGPHLHFGLRVNPYNRQDGWGGYVDPAPYLSSATTPTQPQPQPVPELLPLIKEVAQEFGLDWQLLASQAWAESSFNPKAVSSAGAQGLLQIMPNTWAEWSPKVNGGNDPFDPRQNLRVGAAYLKWLLPQTKGNVYDALSAYGWGIGNWLGGEPVPPIWVGYANKIVHGRDLLRAVD